MQPDTFKDCIDYHLQDVFHGAASTPPNTVKSFVMPNQQAALNSQHSHIGYSTLGITTHSHFGAASTSPLVGSGGPLSAAGFVAPSLAAVIPDSQWASLSDRVVLPKAATFMNTHGADYTTAMQHHQSFGGTGNSTTHSIVGSTTRHGGSPCSNAGLIYHSNGTAVAPLYPGQRGFDPSFDGHAFFPSTVTVTDDRRPASETNMQQITNEGNNWHFPGLGRSISPTALPENAHIGAVRLRDTSPHSNRSRTWDQFGGDLHGPTAFIEQHLTRVHRYYGAKVAELEHAIAALQSQQLHQMHPMHLTNGDTSSKIRQIMNGESIGAPMGSAAYHANPQYSSPSSISLTSQNRHYFDAANVPGGTLRHEAPQVFDPLVHAGNGSFVEGVRKSLAAGYSPVTMKQSY